MAVTNKPRIEVVTGASGSGKSAYAKQLLKTERPKHLIIFDPMGEYADFADTSTNMNAIGRVLDGRGANGRGFKVGYRRPDPKRGERPITDEQLIAIFNKLCGWAYDIGDVWLVADELQKVTDSKNPPPSWQDCTSRGRHYGMTIIGMCQRPSDLDKSFFDNATKIRTGRLIYKPSVKTMADILNVTSAEILQLNSLEYIERDLNANGQGSLVRGKLKF